MTAAFNPYLPSYEYVPDGEPHIFEGRLYVFGSHDAFNGPEFCVNDYVAYSAPLDDLGAWRFEGFIYRAKQDPLNAKGKEHMNAPDVCQGADGRYYLYYQLHREVVTSVAVADKPAGPYEFYGHVKHPDGTLYGKKKGDAYNFDPGMLADTDGRIYMYTGFSPDKGFLRTVMKLRGGAFDSGTVAELETDMLTIKGTPKATVPGEIFAKNTEFEGHGFFEASSPRKINGRYYLVYSSVQSHELCYATSDSPMGTWHYGGTIISNGDIGLPGVTADKARNFTGNTHGGLVEVDGQWYVFYHRHTNQQMCARQGCAEKIEILPDGSIPQVEMTSCGLNRGPLPAKGTYQARIACNLMGASGTYKYAKAHDSRADYPFFTQTGEDRESDGDQYIANMKSGAMAGFKYFLFDGSEKEISVKGKGSGSFAVSDGTKELAVVPVNGSAELKVSPGTHALYFIYKGTDVADFRTFTIH